MAEHAWGPPLAPSARLCRLAAGHQADGQADLAPGWGQGLLPRLWDRGLRHHASASGGRRELHVHARCAARRAPGASAPSTTAPRDGPHQQPPTAHRRRPACPALPRPAQLYLAALEAAKSATHNMGSSLGLSEPSLAGLSSFVGGAAASAAAQSITVPVDVVSQRCAPCRPADPLAAAAAPPGSCCAACPVRPAQRAPKSPGGAAAPAAAALLARSPGSLPPYAHSPPCAGSWCTTCQARARSQQQQLAAAAPAAGPAAAQQQRRRRRSTPRARRRTHRPQHPAPRRPQLQQQRRAA